MPAKSTTRFLAARSGMRLLRAARIWVLLGFQGVTNFRRKGRHPRSVFYGNQKTTSQFQEENILGLKRPDAGPCDTMRIEERECIP